MIFSNWLLFSTELPPLSTITKPIFDKPFPLPKWFGAMPSIWQNAILHNLTLAVNHVLQQEPQAIARLSRAKNKTVQLQIQSESSTDCTVCWCITPAGLLEYIAANKDNQRHVSCKFDLCVSIKNPSPETVLQMHMTQQKPEIKVEGDVQLAAEINWLFQHVRWDIEEDLSRLLGDGLAHTTVMQFKKAVNSQTIEKLKKKMTDFCMQHVTDNSNPNSEEHSDYTEDDLASKNRNKQE